MNLLRIVWLLFLPFLLLDGVHAQHGGCASKCKTPCGAGTSDGGETVKTAVIRNHLEVSRVQAQMAKLAPVVIDHDRTLLDETETRVLKLLVRAARHLDGIFLDQVYAGNHDLLNALTSSNDPAHRDLLAYFRINFGPFDRLDGDRPFINLDRDKPAGANFYPPDMKKREFTDWLKAHPEDEDAFTSNFTVIRRRGDDLVAVPYAEVYGERLRPAAELMEQAAALTANPSLKAYLLSRAGAFFSNDYFQSDMDWMDLKDHRIEIVIGPYEVYEDNLFGYKAAFEAFVTIVDPEESAKLQRLARHLDAMERGLPIEDRFKNFERGESSPILVVQEVYTAGDTKAGIQTTAFNLPNDERVREAKGSKKVMLKNIARAKFDTCWIPIVNRILSEGDLPFVSFEAYFNHVLMHEISHGLGPGNIVLDGRKTTVNRELKDAYSTIEEAKADVLGIWNLQMMIAKGEFPADLEKKMYVSYLGGVFRSIRFGIASAHGGGTAIQLNYLMEKGAFVFDGEAVRFHVDLEKIKPAVRELARTLLMIQALGDYEGAVELIKRYRVESPAMKKALARLADVPVDIRPVYAIEKEL